MKNFFKSNAKRLLAITLCFLMIFSALPLTAFAWTSSEGVPCSSYRGGPFVGYDGKNYFYLPANESTKYEPDDPYWAKPLVDGTAIRKYMLRLQSGESSQVYCVESEVRFNNSDNAYISEDYANSSFFKNLPYSVQYGIMLTTVFGWVPGRETPVSGTNNDDYSLATQIIIWEYQRQFRTSPTNLQQNSEGLRADHFFRSIQGRPAEKCYNWLLEQMARYETVPSFASSTSSAAAVHTLRYDINKGLYTTTLIDTKNTLADLKLTDSNGITVTREGNQYTLTSTEMISDIVALTVTEDTGLTPADSMLIWGRPDYQTVLTGIANPVRFYIKVNSETYGTGKIVKTSEDDKVSGITFTVTGNGVNKTVTTSADGTVEIPDLLPGVYTVTEQNADKYEPQSVQRVTIVSGHTSTVTFNNILKRGGLKLTKTSEDGLVEGIKFHLYGTSLSGLAVDEYAVTDASGIAEFKSVLISGSTPYTLAEVDTAIRYVIPIAQTATVNWNEVTNKSFTNILKKWNVTITKSDKETGKTIPYAGAGFQIYRPDGSLVTQIFTDPSVTTINTFYTNDKGTLVTPEKLEYGTGYSLVEVQAPYGYVLDSTPVKFDVVDENSEDENGITVIKVVRPNMAQKGVINISKTGEVFSAVTENNGIYQPVYKIQGLPGAVYEIIAAENIVTPDGTVRAKKGEVVDTVTTDSAGTVTSRELYLGKYEIVERTAPYGMVLNEEVHEVELTYAGQEISITKTKTSFHNERQKVEISLDKSLEQDKHYGIGMNDEIFDVAFGLFAAKDIIAADGSIIPADSLIEIVTLDKNGHGVCRTDLPFGSFYLKELSTNAAYRPSDTQYPIIFEYAGQDTALVKLTANGGNAIENELLRGSLKVIKTFEGKTLPVMGVKFTITGKTVTGIEIVINAVTDENGEIILDNLPIGKYTVTELESELTAGYVLSPEQTAFVSGDKIAEMTIDNTLMRGDLKIIKTFEGMTVPVAGVKFTVTGKTLTGEDYSGEFETDEEGCITIEGLLTGEYKVKEIESDLTVGYVLSEEEAAVITHDQVTELQIENKLIRGNVKLIKTDKDSGAKLAGAVFDLYDPDGNLLGSYTTDQNGEIFVENLPYGLGYKLVESKVPEGYKPEKAELSFDITENGAQVGLLATNEKLPVIPKTPGNIPKTGENSNIWIWMSLMSASIMIYLVSPVIILRRKRAKK